MPDVDEAIDEAVEQAVDRQVDAAVEEAAEEAAEDEPDGLVAPAVVVAVDEPSSPMQDVAAGLDVVSHIDSLLEAKLAAHDEQLLTSVSEMITVAIAMQPEPVVVAVEPPPEPEDDGDPEPGHPWFKNRRRS